MLLLLQILPIRHLVLRGLQRPPRGVRVRLLPRELRRGAVRRVLREVVQLRHLRCYA